MTFRLKTLILLAALCWNPAASAEEYEPARYTVEVIVFRHVDQSRNTPEIPAPASMIRDSELGLDVTQLTPPTGLNQQASHSSRRRAPLSFYLLELEPTYPDIVQLNAEALELKQTFARLQRLDAYDPIAHANWIHMAKDSDSARPYTLEAGQISGTVTLYKERYVHLELDLTYALPDRTVIPIGDTAETGRAADAAANADENAATSSTVVPGQQYQLQESRRVRSGELHYFDHPQFGVIAMVQPLATNASEQSSLN